VKNRRCEGGGGGRSRKKRDCGEGTRGVYTEENNRDLLPQKKLGGGGAIHTVLGRRGGFPHIGFFGECNGLPGLNVWGKNGGGGQGGNFGALEGIKLFGLGGDDGGGLR